MCSDVQCAVCARLNRVPGQVSEFRITTRATLFRTWLSSLALSLTRAWTIPAILRLLQPNAISRRQTRHHTELDTKLGILNLIHSSSPTLHIPLHPHLRPHTPSLTPTPIALIR